MGNLTDSHQKEFYHVCPGSGAPWAGKNRSVDDGGGRNGSGSWPGCSYQEPAPTSDSCTFKVNSTTGVQIPLKDRKCPFKMQSYVKARGEENVGEGGGRNGYLGNDFRVSWVCIMCMCVCV